MAAADTTLRTGLCGLPPPFTKALRLYTLPVRARATVCVGLSVPAGARDVLVVRCRTVAPTADLAAGGFAEPDSLAVTRTTGVDGALTPIRGLCTFVSSCGDRTTTLGVDVPPLTIEDAGLGLALDDTLALIIVGDDIPRAS